MLVAGWQDWSTTDLVWSLWISSLLVGYAFLVLHLFTGATSRERLPSPLHVPAALFGLLFFTVHFGGFHFVHSVFLNEFFPLAGESSAGALTAAAPYWWGSLIDEAVSRYWPFLFATAISRRAAFLGAVSAAPDTPPPCDSTV